MPEKHQEPGRNRQKNLCGVHLKRLRKTRGFTLTTIQAALEQEYGLSLDRTSLGRIEQGTRAVTDIELGALSDLFAVSEAELLWGTTSSTSDQRKQCVQQRKPGKRRLSASPKSEGIVKHTNYDESCTH